ncbi:hypothetical protein G6F60_014661 [Rhizopus arrhizus]|nr:hypothetical protein G6F60_014661 [Rhizopus arrhizus]
MPSPSAPITYTSRAGSAARNTSSPPSTRVAARPQPASRRCALACAVAGRCPSGAASAPPSATRAAAPDSASVLPSGSSSALAPKCAAERRIAPRLCGLPTPSSHSASAGPSPPCCSHCANGSAGARSTSATTPS